MQTVKELQSEEYLRGVCIFFTVQVLTAEFMVCLDVVF